MLYYKDPLNVIIEFMKVHVQLCAAQAADGRQLTPRQAGEGLMY